MATDTVFTDYFLDESGSSGDLARAGERFDFGRQEVFALACLGVADAKSLEEKLKELKRVHRVQAAELKSSSVRDKPGFVADLADYIGETGMPLLIEVVDKRFMIAANIVNALVVPPVGSVDLTPRMHWLKNVMAEYIHAEAPSEVFEAFVMACDSASPSRISGAFDALIRWVRARHGNEVAHVIEQFAADTLNDFKAIDPEDAEACRRFLPIPDTGKRGQSVWMLPNLSSLTNIYARLNHLHERRIGSLTLYHDEQAHFDEILHLAKRTAEGLAEKQAAPEVAFGDYQFEEQARLVFLGSHASAGVQSADILAGFVMRFVKDTLYGKCPPSDDSKDAFRRILELSRPDEGLGINFVLQTADVLKCGVIPA